MSFFPEAPPAKYVEVPIVVRFGDTDPFGVVFFASYFRYCHQGIEEFFRSLGLQPRDVFRNYEKGFGLPIVSASCDFFHPLRYGDTLNLAVFIIQAKSKALTFGFHFYHVEREKLVAKGHVTLVTIDEDWHSRSVPDYLRSALEPFLPPVQTS